MNCAGGLVKSYAFEPDAKNFAACKTAIEKEKLDYIELLPYAAWDKEETLLSRIEFTPEKWYDEVGNGKEITGRLQKFICDLRGSTHMVFVNEAWNGTGDIVLLMDDVTTTGNSLYACREILINHGAEQIEMFALGKAI